MKIYGSVRLRPTRIGFLVRPNDGKAVRLIMRLCTCLWGGTYNPIIPVAIEMPKVWREERSRLTCRQLAEGYLTFFEPDVFVEAKAGLASEIGINDEQTGFPRGRVVTLDDFVTKQDRSRPEPAYGQSTFDVYRYLYERKYQFLPKHKRTIAAFEPDSDPTGFTEAAFGVFPSVKALRYIENGYRDAFDPLVLEGGLESWLKVTTEGVPTPFDIAHSFVEREPRGHRDPLIFIFDAVAPTDLIDFWNLRQFHDDVLPIHVTWLPSVAERLRQIIRRNHRPLPGNPHGVMIDTTIEFSRSIGRSQAEQLARIHFSDLPAGSYGLKLWYDRIWSSVRDDMVWTAQRARLTAKSTDLELLVDKDDSSTTFPSLDPEFTDFLGGEARWANVLAFRGFERKHDLAFVFPTNVKDPSFPRMGSGREAIVTREGIVFAAKYHGERQYVRLMRGREAFSEFLQQHGIKSAASDAGRIADQVLASVGGLWGAFILAHPETLKLLDRMAKSIRVRPESDGNEVVEEYLDRTAHAIEWRQHLQLRFNQKSLRKIDLSRFTDAGILRLGIVVRCTVCSKENWYGLAGLDYELTCERCLNKFKFPQGTLDPKDSANWRYRVVGPFSVPNLGAGSYPTVLALRVFSEALGVGDRMMTYCTGLEVELGADRFEIDFALWYRRDHAFEESDEPILVFGEAKGFSERAFQARDVRRLKAIGGRFPGSALVAATLKESLSESDKRVLRPLAAWGRLPMPNGYPRCPLIVLTGVELFSTWRVDEEWKKKGGQLAKFAERASIRLENLRTLAVITQSVHLGMEDYHRWLERYYQKRHQRKSRRKRSNG